MKVVNSNNLNIIDYEAVVILVDEGRQLSYTDEEVEGAMKFAESQMKFDYLEGNEIAFVPIIRNDFSREYIFVYINNETMESPFELLNAFGKVVKRIQKTHLNKVAFVLNDYFNKKQISLVAEAIVLANYKFEKYKTNKKDKANEFIFDIITEEETSIDQVINICESTNLVRDLVNEPADIINPESLGRKVEELFDGSSVEVKLYNKEDIQKLNMNAYLAVARGSNNPPVLMVMKYIGDVSSEKTIGLVGKGITYDSGGYSLKSTDSMLDMKNDMAGAAAVIGTILSLSKNKVKANVTAVVAACENIISSKSYKPGDIIFSMSGKTIEVRNTDAEGRLTLIDAVTYIINEENVDNVIDIATLTGAAVAAFGVGIAPILSTDENIYNAILRASNKCGEKIWRMPYDKEVGKQNISDIADYRNVGIKYCGMITAGMFVGEFRQELPWAHIDIAGTASTSKELPICPKGATGFGTRLLYNMVENLI